MKIIAAAALLTLGMSAGAYAATTTIDLGQSTQDYTLYGQGAVSPGVGSFTNQQGAETGVGTVTDTLTGTISGSSNPGLSSGSYSFVTTYTGVGIGAGGMEIQSQSDPSDLIYFYYTYFDPSVSMTLYLTGTPTGDHAFMVVSGGNYVADLEGLNFSYVSASCTGVAVCTQNNVGLTPGATQYGSVDTTVSFTTGGVPEPASWALMLVGAAAMGGVLRKRRTALAA